MQSIYLGGGCFWCTEAIFNIIKGVEKVVPGYMGGETNDPTYQQVCSGKTGHAEVIQCIFNEKIISLKEVLTIFFSSHDPTQLNRQGNDVGTQYRSIIFCSNKNEKEIVENFIESISHAYDKNIVTKVEINNKFFKAESYHVEYFNRNSNAPYCQIVIKPKLLNFKKKHKNKLIKS